jgi:sulfhydrogenase subunit beta (sulfur reductase)
VDQHLFLQKADLDSFLKGLAEDYAVYVPVKKGKQRFYKQYPLPIEEIVIGEVRPFEPLKAFFTGAREIVSKDFNKGLPETTPKPYAIVGVKACDLKGFKVQDFVFSGAKNQGVPDPFYLKNRERNLIISADCTCAIDTCFCLALGIKPHPQEDFDLNFSETEEGFLVEIGSQKGETLAGKFAALFQKNAPAELAKKKETQRARVIKEVEENIKKNDIPDQNVFGGIIERNFESAIWLEESKTCVECGACNTICPTCHCFLLYDQKDEEKMERLRMWDSCMIKDFARVAGGANPRKKLWMRLRNRFEKKFDFFPKVSNVYACTGCGRCVSACPAKIDIRKVLRRLVNHA